MCKRCQMRKRTVKLKLYEMPTHRDLAAQMQFVKSDEVNGFVRTVHKKTHFRHQNNVEVQTATSDFDSPSRFHSLRILAGKIQ